MPFTKMNRLSLVLAQICNPRSKCWLVHLANQNVVMIKPRPYKK